MARNHRSRSFSRQKGRFIWTSVLFEGFNVPITPVSSNIVEDADWTAVAGNTGATLMAIRGWWSAQGQTGTGNDSLLMLIALVDADIASTSTSLDPAAVATYTDEDVLWTGGWTKAQVTEVGVRAGSGQVEVNIKARRKIRSGQEIRLCQTTTNDEIGFSGVFRALLKLG